MAESDPFTQITDRLWAIIEGHAGSAALVRVGNRAKVRFKAQVVGTLAPADTIELSIRPAPGGGANLRATTSGSRFIQNFTIAALVVGTDPTRLFPLKWELLKAFAAAGPDLGLAGLCTKVTFPDLSESPDSPPPGAPDIEQASWTGFVSVSVEFWRPTTSLTGVLP